MTSRKDKTIYRLFEEQVEKTPDNIAAASRTSSVTYKELARRAGRLARVLNAGGVAPGSVVAIYGERTIDRLIEILAILKAGAAYMPLDPGYPEERIRYMLEDSNAKFFPGSGDGAPGPGSPSLRTAGPLDLAYILYTSGSTGRPKGVAVEHRSVVNLLYALSDAYPVSPSGAYLLKTSFLFDVSVTELFGWFMGGGRLVLMEKGGEKDPRRIIDTIEAAGVTHVNFVPAMFNTFVHHLDPQNTGKISCLKYIFLAGEVLAPGLVDRFRRLNTGIRLENLYGPTEGTVYAAGYSLSGWDGTGSIPIGKPLAGVDIHILDEQGRPAVPGETGELCIAGAGVARGYLNNPELTARVFNRFYRSYKSYKTYKTGDLARWLPDGNIQFLGRIDHQVKIRGFRVELGEIENQLLKHGAIKEAVVVAGEDKTGDKYLCAYIAGEDGIDKERFDKISGGAGLKEYLSRTLPDFMIPSFFVTLERLPLSSSGKVDRKSLPEPKTERRTEYIAPGNKTEERLAELWSDVLGIEKQRIGIHDNFFELGGHSLKGAGLLLKIHKAFNVRLRLSHLFDMPTIGGLSACITDAAEDRFLPLEKAEKKEYYRLSSAQMRLYILHRVNPGSTAYNIPLLFELAGAPERKRLEDSFKKLIARHESLRTSFRVIREEPVQVVHERVEFNIEYHETAVKGINRFVRPFDLTLVPLVRAAVIGVEGGGYRLLIDMHHIISDGLSMDTAVGELLRLYDSKELSPPRFQYRDYSEWLNREKREVRTRAASRREYWLREFPGEIPLLSLPLDHTRPGVRGFEGETLYFEVEKRDSTELHALSNAEKVTPYMLFLAAYYVLLAKLSGQEDIVVGTPLSGRKYVEMRDVIGMFVKTLALRHFPGASKPFNRFLKEVKERTLTAFENQDYPFEELVEALGVERDVSRSPLFDCMFGLENIEAVDESTPGLGLKPCRFDSKISKYDLTLTVEQEDEDVTLRVEYDTNLFERETVNRFTGYFLEILRTVQSGPSKKISEIEIISEKEKRKILNEFNNTAAGYPRDKTIHRLFEEQARRTPDAVALSMSDKTDMTYGELNRESDGFATFLREKGVRPGTVVGIMVERSVEMVVGVLAILRAGCVYLPIDPGYPEERKQYMLKDCSADILVTADTLTEGAGALRPGMVPPGDHAASLAYVIYTSGSTGTPKGVAVEHRSVVNVLFALFDAYPVFPSDAYLLKTSFIFDVVVTELFGWFMGGGRLAVLEAGGEKDPQTIIDTINRHRVTHINFVPSMFNAFVGKMDHRSIKKISGLRYIFLAGEALVPGSVNRFRRFNTPIRLENLYGPTEGTVYASGYSLSRWDNTADIPIGKPLPNVNLVIQGNGGRLKAIGETGELCIAGSGVARGYLNNPELTARAFNRSYGSYKSYKTYKTGDLARWLPDGNIQFLGRIDRQVKIRGFRIELGDVESHLLTHPHIKEAVVMERETEEDRGEKYLCAYLVSDRELPVSHLREYLSGRLPGYMIPGHFVFLEKLPLTPGGKVDRGRLPAPARERPRLDAGYVPPHTELEKLIGDAWKEVLKLESVGIHDKFFDLGGNSMKFIQVAEILEKQIGKEKEIPVLTMFQYPTVHSLARHLSEDGESREAMAVKSRYSTSADPGKGMGIAVIGMAGRFPGSANIDEFWDNLKQGIESVSFFSMEELEEAGIDGQLLGDPCYVRARGFLEGGEYFDSEFFNYSPGEAEMMDPQLRIYHECTWSALEDAGYDPGSYDGVIGNYAGAQFNVGWMSGIAAGGGTPSEQFSAEVLNSNFSFSSRISYNFNLTGPSFTLQTACSTSLAAIHLACRGLSDGECDMALAGGIRISDSKKSGYLYQEGMIMSPDGHCRAFDADAGGIVDGDGVGVVVLKRFDDACGDGDHIYAVIRGSAVNNDGTRKAGYTVPGIEGQVEVICRAHKAAGVDAESITYIETHGTATPLGDPIEIEALKRAFVAKTEVFGSPEPFSQKGFWPPEALNICAVGSVKTNIGHLDNAAGAAGFIKAVLALAHGQIPPGLHYRSPNPKIDFEGTPFYVNTRLKEWETRGHPRRAGVSSFGVGGTNAHVVLEEWPGGGEPESKEKPHQLILLSARTASALETMVSNLSGFFRKHPRIALADAAYTLQTGRKAFKYRAMTVCSTVEEAVKNLSSGGAGKLRRFEASEDVRTVVFMFSGQGNQYVNMGLDMYCHEPVFKEEMDRCFDILNTRMGVNIKDVLYPDGSFRDRAESEINRLVYSSPIKFSFEYALARVLMRWGIQPGAMIGHSFGEYVAACLAGVFSLEDALALSVWRSRLMSELPGGAMLGVSLSEAELRPLLGEGISLAAVNAPSSCYVSGAKGAIESFETYLKGEEIECIRLKVPCAGHSSMMRDIAGLYRRKIEGITLNKPRMRYISGLTGKWITDAEAVDPGYWTGHLCRPVRFFDGLIELFKEPGALFVQVGPGRGLTMFVDRHPGKKPGNQTVNMVRHHRENVHDVEYLMNRIGDLWLYGVCPARRRFYPGERRQRIPLPTYPFERRDYSSNRERFKLSAVPGKAGPPARTPNIDDWFYVPSWTRSVSAVNLGLKLHPPGHWLVFLDDRGTGRRLADRLVLDGAQVVTVKRGESFLKESPDTFTINPKSHHDYDTLIRELVDEKTFPGKIVHLWGVTGKGNNGTGAHRESPGDRIDERIDRALDNGFYSLFYLARAIGKTGVNEKTEIEVVTDNMQEVTGGETLYPLKSTVLGPVRVIPKEYSNITCRCTDIESTENEDENEETVDRLLKEFRTGITDTVTAYRGRFRWVQAFRPVSLNVAEEPPYRLRERGVYLVTGGLGGIGLALAGYLARSVRARLILTTRSPFPPREEWENRVRTQNGSDNVGERIRSLLEFERSGAEVLVISADVTDENQMRDVLTMGMNRFGRIHGIIHSAGVVDGRVMQFRTKEMVEAILAPKVKGTLVLDALLKDMDPDFFFLCSSLNSVFSVIGQVAYTAANNFLDSFARGGSLTGSGSTLSINWDTWREVGMAVEAAKGSGKSTELIHPLFDHYLVKDPGRVVYVSRFKVDRCWFLDEHRVMGKAVLPGTAYLEMIVRAVEHHEHHAGGGNIEITDMYFPALLGVGDTEEKEVHTILEKQGEIFEFIIRSRMDRDRWQEHARGKISFFTGEGPGKHDVEAIKSEYGWDRAGETVGPGKKKSPQSQFVTTGPRWENTRQMSVNENRGTARFELPEAFLPDLETYKLHPALLDTATAFLPGKMSEKTGTAYVPFSIKKIRVLGTLPRTVVSHARVPGGNNRSQKKGLDFNISIMDETGSPLIDIQHFFFMEVSPGSIVLPGETMNGEDTRVPSPAVEPEHLKDAIRPGEGIEVFKRLLSSELGVSQVLVSTRDLPARLEWDKHVLSPYTPYTPHTPHTHHTIETTGGDGSAGAGYHRPELSTPYRAAGNLTEQALVDIWERFFGIEPIGVTDDFFELGGDSLKALTIISRIRKELNAEVSMTDFFSTPSIRGAAEFIGGSQRGGYVEISPVETREYYPQSSAQLRLFLHQRMQPGNLFYNITIVYIIEGPLDVNRLENAYRALIQRHESLRTSFDVIDEIPVQKVHGDVEFKLGYRTAGADVLIESLVKTFVRPFDLARAPLMRVGLVKTGREKHLWLFDIHHIVTDAGGCAVLQKDLMALYNKNPGKLPPLTLQYKDFSAWQNNLIRSGGMKDREEYWLKVFPPGREIPRLDLPTDFPRPGRFRFRGGRYYFELGVGETRDFKELAAGAGATLFANLLAVLNVLLFKYTGQEDIIVGTASGARPHADLADIVGMFVNMLPMRNFPHPGKTYFEFLKEVKTACLDAFENRDVQFEILVERLGLETGTARNPLFDICLNVQTYEQPELQMDGVTLTPYTYETDTSKFDMLLWANPSENNIHFMMEYSTELFKAETVEKFSTYFMEIIRQVTRDRDCRLKDIEVSHRLLVPETEIPDIAFGFQ